jgi:Uma2 family endonuclease
MVSQAIQTVRYSFDDFLTLMREDQKADLLDGHIYMASPESIADNKLGGWLYRLMSEFAAELELGEVFFSRVAFRLSSKHAPEPDVAFVASANVHRIQVGYVAGPPDIAIEIVSPDSRDRDYIHKRRLYEKSFVREYWIIDPDERRATFLTRHRGKYRDVALTGTIFESTVLPGFKLDCRWFWTARRPAVLRILRDLLS